MGKNFVCYFSISVKEACGQAGNVFVEGKEIFDLIIVCCKNTCIAKCICLYYYNIQEQYEHIFCKREYNGGVRSGKKLVYASERFCASDYGRTDEKRGDPMRIRRISYQGCGQP
jgi:hypothetical protein